MTPSDRLRVEYLIGSEELAALEREGFAVHRVEKREPRQRVHAPSPYYADESWCGLYSCGEDIEGARYSPPMPKVTCGSCLRGIDAGIAKGSR